MLEPTPSIEARGRALCEVLLGYLQSSQVTVWPGTDGLTVKDILDEYPAAAAASQVPRQVELMYRHPELASEVTAFFAAHAPLGGPRR